MRSPDTTRARRLLVAIALHASAACGEPSPSGLDQPLRVGQGVFKQGELPGTPAKGTSADDKVMPQVTAIVSLPSVLRPASADIPFEARATPDAYAIGIRFTKLGSGFWVAPLLEPDVVNQGELSWRVTASLGEAIAPGNHEIELVAFDGHGHAGLKRTRTVCVVPQFDDNLNACDPTVAPPAAVITLAWSTDMDLDLRVRTPSGKLVDASHPATGVADAGTPSNGGAGAVGLLDYDSNAGCALDSGRMESLVFQDDPEPGDYFVYVGVFTACGKSSADFEVQSYRRLPGSREGTFRLEASPSPTHGHVLAINADGDEGLGTFVAKLRFP